MGEALFALMMLAAWILVPALVVLGLVPAVRRMRPDDDRAVASRASVPGVATGHHRRSEAGGLP